jgi:hypothetical protein
MKNMISTHKKRFFVKKIKRPSSPDFKEKKYINHQISTTGSSR